MDNEKLTTLLKMGFFPVTDDFWYAAGMPFAAKKGFTWAFRTPLSKQPFMPYQENTLEELTTAQLEVRASLNLTGTL